MDDGSVEIVALADSDLAAITPKAPRADASAAHLASTNMAAAQAAPVRECAARNVRRAADGRPIRTQRHAGRVLVGVRREPGSRD